VAGGINGKGMTGYSGGNGGESGELNISGSGGAGGGATTITLYETGQSLNNIELAIAGGGGGSGGSGGASRGGTGINTNSATANTPDSLGEEGADHPYDGGGGGAGGGGADGGKGASAGRGDAGGEGGWSGSNLVPGGGSANDGSGISPSGTTTMVTIDGVSTNVYEGRVAKGGTADAGDGGDGKAVIVFNIPAEARYKVSGAWKSIPKMHYKVSGLWKKIIGGYRKVGGVWKALFSSDIVFTSYATGFGDAAGGATSGSAGTNETPTASTIPASAPYIEGSGGDQSMPLTRIAQDWTTDAAWESGNQQVPMPAVPQEPSWSGSCFIAGTMVRMADGTDIKIEDIIVGDIVKGKDGDDKVIALDPTLLGNRKLYAFNGSTNFFVTSEHPFWTTDGWKSIKPEKTKERDGVDLYNELTGALEVGHEIQTLDGIIRIKSIEKKEINTPDLQLYNFNVENDHSYFADGYCVHNKGGGGKGIVCTSMYQTTGLEDWRRAMAIWRLYHKKVLGDERGVQEGYHWTFKPYVRGMRRSKVLRFIGAWLARHVTNHMKTKLYKRGLDKTDAPFKHNFKKTDIAGKIILAVSEPTLRAIGRVLKMLNMDKGEQ
jgi:hypothetical protein